MSEPTEVYTCSLCGNHQDRKCFNFEGRWLCGACFDHARETALREKIAALRARVAELEAIQAIAHVQVDDLGYLWLNLNGGEGCYKASVNITAKVELGGSIVRGGVRQATEALRALGKDGAR